MSAFLKLAERCEAALGPDRKLDIAILGAIGAPVPFQFMGKIVALNFDKAEQCYFAPIGDMQVRYEPPNFTASLDAAMTLVPASAANIDIFSFSSGWGCRFHDTAQLMGKRAAKEEIARVQKGASSGSVLRGPAAVYLERAIAEHYIEFYCLAATTPALALCAAALRARAA